MTIEQLWYMSYDAEGNPPKMGRLAYLPIDRVWESAIDLAIAFESGQAGYRQLGKNSVTGECIWYWPHEEIFHRELRHMDWWKIPNRIEQRCFALVNAAIDHEIRRGHGSATGDAVVNRLKAWRRTGTWRKIASTIYPKHPGPPKKKRGRKPGRKRKAVRKA